MHLQPSIEKDNISLAAIGFTILLKGQRYFIAICFTTLILPATEACNTSGPGLKSKHFPISVATMVYIFSSHGLPPQVHLKKKKKE